MLKIIIIKSRGESDFTGKFKLDQSEMRMLAEFVVANWLDTGYRNPKCFGLQPSVEKELEPEYYFFQAARIFFEHMMLMTKIPEDVQVAGYDIAELNKHINVKAGQVYVFWSRLVTVDISEIMTPVRSEVIESSIMKIDDLQLIYFYA
jgi:hypothetical protein